MTIATKSTKHRSRVEEIGGAVPTNGAAATIATGEPYTLDVTLCGVSSLLMHRYNVEAVAEKGAASKGSKAKKSDDLESYVYRNEAGELCLPGDYLRQAIIHAAKFRQDPRSPRKSAMDLMKAAIIVEPELASFGTIGWDYVDSRRVLVQRNAITRSRPTMKAGWQLDFSILVLLPEYVGKDMLVDMIGTAGRLIGLADYRPTYGRFTIKSFSVR